MQVLLTVDVEAHRVLDEISGERRDSLGAILSALDRHRMRATFFVDLCGRKTWGDAVMRRTCERIRSGRHDLQLHAHPHHATGDATRWLLSEYTPEEQRAVLRDAVQCYQRYVGEMPSAFRAGGFGLNDATIDLLRELGLKADCSFHWRRPGCAMRPASVGVPSRYRGLVELPLTPLVLLGTVHRPFRVSSLDFNWVPLFVLRRALRDLRAAGAEVVVLLLHSSSMYVRIGRRRLWYRRAHERKLDHLLRFLTEEGLPLTTVADALPTLDWDPSVGARDQIAVTRGPLAQYATLLFQSVIGFGISPRFRAFLVANVVVLAAMLGLLGWALAKGLR